MLTRPDQTEAAPIVGIGAIDCDVHTRLPRQGDLMPFLDKYWQDMFPYRDIDLMELMSYPVSTAPFTRGGAAGPGKGGVEDAATLKRDLLDPLGLGAAVLNVVNGIQAIFDPYLQTVLCQATNRWLASEWLDRDDRLRASLLVPFRNVEAAVKEIEAYAGDKRFVQILALAQGEGLLGQRQFWPIWEAAAKHGFALQIHAGSAYRQAPTQNGFPSYLAEEIALWPQGFATQVASLLAEGVMTEFADMKIVAAESGVSWLFGMTWRVAKDWRGARVEVPWVKESPEEIITRQLRLTTQPFDVPGHDPEDIEAVIDCLGSADNLLWASDYPHAYPGAPGAWPAGLSTELAGAIARDNARATYSRLEVK
ncbi:amidohydrolase [Mesobaculum littorinae]|uniref:Amidohydrolase n=1 Tax=Mesobaculum littorinae TaxID=2486419 RepID=A0A438AHC9_9RHOB|nr:amidohydrolase family protein [Mesobaculum littorinae]RVV98133.1 amidohydrolase [Mesobaculum littorinae]